MGNGECHPLKSFYVDAPFLSGLEPLSQHQTFCWKMCNERLSVAASPDVNALLGFGLST